MGLQPGVYLRRRTVRAGYTELSITPPDRPAMNRRTTKQRPVHGASRNTRRCSVARTVRASMQGYAPLNITKADSQSSPSGPLRARWERTPQARAGSKARFQPPADASSAKL